MTKPSMRPRRWIWLILITVAVPTFAGCAMTPEKPQKPATIHDWLGKPRPGV